MRVPRETAVVALETSTGDRVWQQPIAGYGLLRLHGTREPETTGTVVAYDVDGGEIGRWTGGSSVVDGGS